MWSNYMIVAVDCGELAEACHALSRVVEERAEKVGDESVDHDVLERLVDAVTKASADTHSTENQGQYPNGSAATDSKYNPNEGQGLYNRVNDLFIRTLLPRLSSSPRIFRAYARLLVWKSEWGLALETHMNAYRVSVINDEKVETDISRWREAVIEVEDLVDILTNLGPRAVAKDQEEKGAKKTSWQFQARSVVRTFMGRTKDAFGDEPEWGRLDDVLQSLRKA